MTNKEIIKHLEDIEEVLNLSDKEFAEKYNSQQNEFLVYERIGMVKSQLSFLKDGLITKKDQ